MRTKIIYFTSPGCSICVNQTAILNEIKSETGIEVENHLITTAFDKALKYGVKSAPAMVFLYEDRPHAVKTGFHSKQNLEEIIHMIEAD